MTLGLFAKGLDLMPDFGYPPVQYGGWGSPRAAWYTRSAAHNTVVVDGRNSRATSGKTTLWADGEQFRAVRASGPELIDGQQFERTVAMVGGSDQEFYLVDVFRVVGGAEHVKHTYGHFGQTTTGGLSLKPAEDYGHGAELRGVRKDAAPPPCWSVDWRIDDRLKLLPASAELHFRYTDLTPQAEAITAEAWIAARGFSGTEEAWIPCVMVRRRAEQAPLASTFISVVETYDEQAGIRAVRRLPLVNPQSSAYSQANVALEIQLADGRRDLLIAADVENPLGANLSWKPGRVLIQEDAGVRLDGQLGLIRFGPQTQLRRAALCRAASLHVGNVAVDLRREIDYLEVQFDGERAFVVSGPAEAVERILVDGLPVWPR
jgi:hypothetical protein